MASSTTVNNYNSDSSEGDSINSNEDNRPDASTYFKNLDLSYFVSEPFEMLTKYGRLREKCMFYDNPEAHYIEGVIQYFISKDKQTGLHHLRESSKLNYVNGTYLYGVLLLGLGNYVKGKKYMDKVGWKESLSTSDACWERVKNSLYTIPKIEYKRYKSNLENLRPLALCNLDNTTKMCKKCYYYKRLDQFVQFAMRL